MHRPRHFDVIIVGGSYAGLSAALTLGRSLRSVAIIDSGNPCNKHVPLAHNFLSRDGESPQRIIMKAKQQVMNYGTVKLYNAMAIAASRTQLGYRLYLDCGIALAANKILFATGLLYRLPAIPGFEECWGRSILHCAYCNGYEMRTLPIGILGNGQDGFAMSRLLSNWSSQLILFTNGPAKLTQEQIDRLQFNNIAISTKRIMLVEHSAGQVKGVHLKGGDKIRLSALFTKASFEQHCPIPADLGCELTHEGLIRIDESGRTSLPGVYAAGDNSAPCRTVSIATAAGTRSGTAINQELVMDVF